MPKLTLTKAALLEIRDTTYREPEDRRCMNCLHFAHTHRKCHIVDGHEKPAESYGTCDLWEGKTP